MMTALMNGTFEISAKRPGSTAEYLPSELTF
jgi:hypothetical protein